jgi:serine/threonine protein kinase
VKFLTKMVWRLEEHFEIIEPRVLGHGTYGPVLRARDLHTSQFVALRVYDADESFHSQRLQGCASIEQAREQTLAHFSRQVSAMHSVHRGQTATGALSETWLDALPSSARESCSKVVAALLGYSCDSDGIPARATDGCCYIVTEVGMFSLEQLIRDSQEQLSRGRQPSVPEVRETMRSLFSLLASLHTGGCVLASHAPRKLMRFPLGWKLSCASPLHSVGHRVEGASAALIAMYQPPELSAGVLHGTR